MEGMYRMLPSMDDDAIFTNCCLDLPDIGAPPPDWASQAPHTWKGVVRDQYSGLLAMEWWFDKVDDGKEVFAWMHQMHREKNHHQDGTADTLPFHTTRQVATGQYQGVPLVFTFPGKAEGRQDMHYLPHTMTKSLPPDNALFDLPDGCRQKRCSENKSLPQSLLRSRMDTASSKS